MKSHFVLPFHRCNGRRIPEDQIEKQRPDTRVPTKERVIKVRYDVVAQAVEDHVRSVGGDFSCECHSWYIKDGQWASVQSMRGIVKLACKRYSFTLAIIGHPYMRAIRDVGSHLAFVHIPVCTGRISRVMTLSKTSK